MTRRLTNAIGRRWTCIALGMIMVLLTGCGAPASSSTPSGQTSDQTTSDKPVTIKFMSWQGDVGTPEEIQELLVKPFQAKHPNIKLDVEVLPWDEYWTKIQTLAAAGTPPDVYTQSVAYSWDHANQGVAMNLQQLFDRDLKPEDFEMKPFDIFRYPNTDGDLYAMPFHWVDSVLFYNKTLFDAAGLKYPTKDWTWEDVLTAAKQLTKDSDGDGKVDQWGVDASLNHEMLDSIIKSDGGEVLDKSFTKCKLTEPQAVAAIQWVVDLVHTHKVAPNPAMAGQSDLAPTFASGKVAMMIQGAYHIGSLREVKDFDWDITWTPNGKVTRVVYGGPDGVAIGKQTKYPEAAWELVKYFLSDEIAFKTIIIPGTVPINKKLATSSAWHSAHANVNPANYNVLVEQEPFVVGADFGPSWSEWRGDAMSRELEQAMLGTRSVEDSASAACTAIDTILAKVKR